MKKTPLCKSVTPILVFNPLKRLVGYFHSLTAAASTLGVTNSSIHQACTGSCISCCGLYVRFLDSGIEIEDGDYGSLRLEDYDQMCGVKRSYYPTANMSRKGMEYNKKKTSHENQTT